MEDFISTKFDPLPNGSYVFVIKLNDETVLSEEAPYIGGRREVVGLSNVLFSLSGGRSIIVECTSGSVFREITNPDYRTDDIYIEELLKNARKHNITWKLRQ
jgi:hypothetical protein